MRYPWRYPDLNESFFVIHCGEPPRKRKYVYFTSMIETRLLWEGSTNNAGSCGHVVKAVEDIDDDDAEVFAERIDPVRATRLGTMSVK